jgi:hypothetical protein
MSDYSDEYIAEDQPLTPLTVNCDPKGKGLDLSTAASLKIEIKHKVSRVTTIITASLVSGSIISLEGNVAGGVLKCGVYEVRGCAKFGVDTYWYKGDPAEITVSKAS